MAFIDSSVSTFKLDDSGGTLRTVTPYVNNIDGLPGTRDLNDVTALGDNGHRFIPSIENGKFSISGDYDATASTGIYTVLSSLRSATATASFEYGPEGTTTGKAKLSGESWLSAFNITSKVGSQVSYKADFQIDGAVTVGTYP